MKKLFLSLALISLISANTFSQTAEKKLSAGLFGGAIQYNGDMGSGLFKFQPFYGFKGLSLATYLTKRFDFTLQGSWGQAGFVKNPTENFRTQFWVISSTLKYKFCIDETKKISPYAFAGLGYMRFTEKFSLSNHVETMQIPQAGLGITYKITPNINLMFQEALIYSDHDNLDGIVKNQTNDMFLTHTLGLSFNLGKGKDNDGDGIIDKMDKCPYTPKEAKVNATGCPIDSDLDGVADYLDNCSNTPKEAKVDSKGCPIDSDNDGVADYIDNCPSTPKEAKVDAKGCPIDTDGDGVADYLDKCENTAKGITVDIKGCPVDSDEDGVADYLDKCSNTPAKANVDAEGCPIDTDGDGIADYLDKCPNVKGIAANKGCPEIKKEEKQVFKEALQGIQFETGKDVIKPASFKILDNVVKIMKNNPQYNLLINGHTDNVGKPESNMVLSQKRADAVKAYIVNKGIDASRMTAKGFGETKPVGDNKTAAGRALNRRVEFVVEF
jgi:OmpA-OmpF porin, OOP family